ncbi:MAG: isoquinoline 1-oxidoreductase beta subunit [Paraglaciecola sp.]|jgi:isoquinoline 1-oxidoreductase beta subunit
MGKLATITRRTFMLGATAITGGVVFGFYKYIIPRKNPLLHELRSDQVTLTPYFKIDPDGITIIVPRAEMGQGVTTTLAALVAEELDVLVSDVKIEHGPASAAYYNAAVFDEGVPFAATDNGLMASSMRSGMHVVGKLVGMQITGGSSSTVDAFEKMRIAGAAARDVFMAAGATKFGVHKAHVSTRDGNVVGPNNEYVSYIALAHIAAEFSIPTSVNLKPKKQWKQLGKSQPRHDMAAKCLGTAEFGIDVRLKNMRYATVKMNPYIYQKMLSYDASEALKMPGVETIVPVLDNGVAVIATNTWYAFKAAEKIKFDWGKVEYPANQQSLFALVESSFDERHQDSQNRDDGDVQAQFARAGDNILNAEYRAPLLAHATMEPMNATALYTSKRLDVWAGNQAPTQAQLEGMQLTGLDEEQVYIHTPFMGGGFGRRAEMDFVKYATAIAKTMPGTPVKVTWTREEDITHDCYRPMAIAKFQAVLNNKILHALDIKVAAPSIVESQFGRIDMNMPGPDVTIVQGLWDQPYNIENYRVTGYRVPAGIPVSSWRSVGASQNAFFHESMLDEVAHMSQQDPLQLRLSLINHEVSRKVLQTAGEMANWEKPLPQGHALGVAFCMSFGVPVAQIIEVAASSEGIKIINAYIAADVGQVLDPLNVEAQLMSGLIFGLAAAMMEEITLTDGKVDQTNFHTYDSLRMSQTPNIHIKVLENGDKIRGVGEPGTPPAAPALGNAIFAATGKRIREMPFNKQVNFI